MSEINIKHMASNLRWLAEKQAAEEHREWIRTAADMIEQAEDKEDEHE